MSQCLSTKAGQVQSRLSRGLMLGTLAVLGLLLAVAVAAGFQFSRSLRIPIEALANGTQAIEHGDLGHRIAYARRDEFGVLASRFNIMAEKLQRQTSDLVAARDNLERQVEERTREIARVNGELKELDQQRVRFIGDVSHELRTPLTVLRAEAEVALRGSGKPEPAYRAALSTIVAQAADMSELVEDLLFIARSEADEIRFDFRHVLVAPVVSDAVQDARTLAHGRNLRISVDCGQPGPLVRADPRRLKQALIVVLENATQYADPQTEIEVETLVNGGDHAEIRVRDRGGGIRQDDVPHVFERFYRGANAVGRAAGSGLGLPIARWIIEKHDGAIDLVSTPGHGTEVRLFGPPGALMRPLLLVEDDQRIVSVLRRGLEAEGYAVEVARTGAEALERVQTEEFALIILDRLMPGLDGMEVCRRLRAAGNRTLVLMLTAVDAIQDKIDGLKAGADDYVTKPFAFHEVLARIEALLRRSGAGERPALLQVGDLKLDRAAKVAWRGERKIPLTAREFALLEYLMSVAGVVVNREELLANVWKLNFDPGTKVVDVHVRFLRRKIDEGEAEPLIKTVRGFGYTISASATT